MPATAAVQDLSTELVAASVTKSELLCEKASSASGMHSTTIFESHASRGHRSQSGSRRTSRRWLLRLGHPTSAQVHRVPPELPVRVGQARGAGNLTENEARRLDSVVGADRIPTPAPPDAGLQPALEERCLGRSERMVLLVVPLLLVPWTISSGTAITSMWYDVRASRKSKMPAPCGEVSSELIVLIAEQTR